MKIICFVCPECGEEVSASAFAYFEKVKDYAVVATCTKCKSELRYAISMLVAAYLDANSAKSSNKVM